MKVDLHNHSILSDGMETIPEILDAAVKQKMDVIAITDHNRFSISESFVHQKLREKPLTVIAGCEFSTVYKEKHREIHVIGLFDSIVEKNFADFFAPIDKIPYLEAIIAKLNMLDISITLDEVMEKGKERITKHTGRPQIADVLIEKGYCRDFNQAFDLYIGDRSVHYTNPVDYIIYPDLEEAVSRIIANNGIPVLCHPLYSNFTYDDVRQLAGTYKSCCQGTHMCMEVYYQKYSTEAQNDLLEIAREFQILPVASSDRHHAGEFQTIEKPETNRSIQLILDYLSKPRSVE